MDHDARRGRFYVASVRHRTIAEISADGRVRELWPRHTAGIGSILGVRADASRGLVWATTAGLPQMEGYAPADSLIAGLFRINASSGRIERRWDLPPAKRGHVLGDLAIGPRGDVFVTDSKDPVVYRLRPGADTLEHMTDTLFRSLQGMAPTPDGRLLYVADYSRGLLRIDLATGTVTRVTDPSGASPRGCDGIVWDRGAIIAVQNGASPARIMRYVLDAAGTGIASATQLDRPTPEADEPTIGAIVGSDFVYVANSQWEKYSEQGVRVAGTRLAAPLLIAVPLPQ
jgi:sugar lactone lactonase YvrE